MSGYWIDSNNNSSIIININLDLRVTVFHICILIKSLHFFNTLEYWKKVDQRQVEVEKGRVIFHATDERETIEATK